MKALIVDGEELFRLSMKEVVTVAANFSEIIEAGSETEFLATTARFDEFDLVVMHPASLCQSGSAAPGIEEGRNCLKLVKRLYPSAAIVIVTDTEAASHLWHGTTTVNRGARVTLMINKIRQSLKMPTTASIKNFAAPGTPDVRGLIQAPEAGLRGGEGAPVDLTRLSFRQRQILAMAADGLPNKEIAARLGIAEGTVKAHMHAIFKVLDVSNRTQAVIKYGAVGRHDAPPAAPQVVHHSAF